MYNYMRISVTDRCNLSCGYCSSDKKIEKLPVNELLSFEEIVDFVRSMGGLGVRYVRLTGGEPLLRKGIARLVRMLKGIPGIEEVSMTTNGLLLADHAEGLKAAGLDRVNISLDTLKADRFQVITHGGVHGLDRVWRSIMRAIELDLAPVKLNVILFRGVNDDEIPDFVRLVKDYNLHVRFIEYMGIKKEGWNYVPNHEVCRLIGAPPPFPPEADPPPAEILAPLRGGGKYAGAIIGRGPARYVSLKGAKGLIGFISPISEPFCSSCNRLRLSCDGRLYPCLASPVYLNVSGLIRNGGDIGPEVGRLMGDKPGFGYHKGAGYSHPAMDMCYLGG